jgi:hypothetical protein
MSKDIPAFYFWLFGVRTTRESSLDGAVLSLAGSIFELQNRRSCFMFSWCRNLMLRAFLVSGTENRDTVVGGLSVFKAVCRDER